MHLRFHSAFWRSALVVTLALPASTASGATQILQHARHDLGTVNFPVSCSKQAQVEFNRAVLLLHHST
jgi:hypothetical protein